MAPPAPGWGHPVLEHPVLEHPVLGTPRAVSPQAAPGPGCSFGFLQVPPRQDEVDEPQ